MQDSSDYIRALESLVDLSSQDATATIAKENAYLGIMRILTAYRQEGHPDADVRLIGLPDMTMTRNHLRWQAGFSYGCVILMDSALPPLIPIDFRPNCCGVTLAEIDRDNFEFSHVVQKLHDGLDINKEMKTQDLSRGNHFVAVLRTGGRFFALLHSSFAEVKKDTPARPGLYSEQSAYWSHRTRSVEIGDQTFTYLYGDDAEEYYTVYKKSEAWTKRIRSAVISDLFPCANVVFNETHEGFFDIKTLLLGAYVSHESFDFPLMVAPDVPMTYLHTNKTLKMLTGDDSLPELYVSPHGAGYAINDAVSGAVSKVSPTIYEIEFRNRSVMHCTNIQGLMLSYRKDVTDYWCDCFGASKKLFDLEPVFFAKI
jgi:hypothetical protein